MREVGAKGERAVVSKLIEMGYDILETNFTTKMGEIDIISKDGEEYVFTEVKLRTNVDFDDGRNSITKRKQAKIKRTALFYSMRFSDPIPMRFDAVIVNASDHGNIINEMEIIKNAF